MNKIFNIEDKLPAKSDYYLCLCYNSWRVLFFSSKHQLFNAHDEFTYDVAETYSLPVTHWTCLPKKPKGD